MAQNSGVADDNHTEREDVRDADDVDRSCLTNGVARPRLLAARSVIVNGHQVMVEGKRSTQH